MVPGPLFAVEPNKVGNLAILLAMRLASSIVQHIGYVSIRSGLSPINVSERLGVSVLHFVAAWNLFDRPWWGEALSQ